MITDNVILSKFVCRETDEMEQNLQRTRIMFGIADKGVDRLTDIVISQQAHIRELEYDLFRVNCELQQLEMTKFQSKLRASKTNPMQGEQKRKLTRMSNFERTGADSSHNNAQPSHGMIRCGSSQLNNKLEKMKSTPDLLGDFRKITGGSESLRDYFMRQKPKEQPNLEDVIKESVIEASNTEDQQQNI